MKLSKFSAIAGMIGLLSMAACNGTSNKNPEGTSNFGVAAEAQALAGNSVTITGTRSTAAGPEFPCVSNATGCFNFDANGVATPATPAVAAEFNNLCPSTDTPNGTWTFTYTFHHGAGCNPDAPLDVTCFSEADLFTRAHPNETLNETLPPGHVENKLFCLNQNTQKTFVFDECREISEPSGGTTTLTVFNCGCTRASEEAACACDFDVTTLPSQCHLDEDCNIRCEGGTCACDDVFLPVFCTSNQTEYANACFAQCAGATGCSNVCACDTVFLPVTCGNGIIYANQCIANCQGATECGIQCACDDVFLPVFCTSNNTEYANECAAECDGATGCSNVCACDTTYVPVLCTSNGVTYANQCIATCAGATGCGNLCACDTTFVPVVCSNGIQYANQCIATCAGATGCSANICACDEVFNPVVCSNGVTYANQCIATCEHATGCAAPVPCPDTIILVHCTHPGTPPNGEGLPNGTYVNQCAANAAGASGCTEVAGPGTACACDNTFIPVTCTGGTAPGVFANLCQAECGNPTNSAANCH